MTREEIEKAAETQSNFTLDDWVDFALDMVRRHNEELQNKFQDKEVVPKVIYDWRLLIRGIIREAKP